MGSAILLTSRNAYDKMKVMIATGSRNDAQPMIVVLKSSLKVSFQLNKVIAPKMNHLTPLMRRQKPSFQRARALKSTLTSRHNGGDYQTTVLTTHFAADNTSEDFRFDDLGI
jgi:hypothetical protein